MLLFLFIPFFLILLAHKSMFPEEKQKNILEFHHVHFLLHEKLLRHSIFYVKMVEAQNPLNNPCIPTTYLH